MRHVPLNQRRYDMKRLMLAAAAAMVMVGPVQADCGAKIERLADQLLQLSAQVADVTQGMRARCNASRSMLRVARNARSQLGESCWQLADTVSGGQTSLQMQVTVRAGRDAVAECRKLGL